MNAAVVLTCHNRKAKTLVCLDALFGCALPENVVLQVHLVDDGSIDGTGEAVRARFPQVHVHPGDGHLFWAGGMRRAWEEAARIGYDYYLWLNDDTILEPHALNEMLVSSAQMEDRAIIVGSTVAPTDPQKLTYGGRTKAGALLSPNGALQPCAFFNGNIVLIPDFVFRRLGNIDPYYRHSFGDFDYGYRALRAGVGQYVAPTVSGVCEAHTSRPKWCNPKVGIVARLCAFYSPLGCHPLEVFHLDRVRSNALVGGFHIVTTHLRVLFPWLWRGSVR